MEPSNGPSSANAKARLRALGRPAGLLLLVLLVALPFLNRPRLVGGDEPHYLVIAHALAIDGELDLGPVYERAAEGGMEAGAYWSGRDLDHHGYPLGDREIPAHPIGLPLIVAPLLALRARLLPGLTPDTVVAIPTILLTFVALCRGWRLLRDRTGDPRAASRMAFALVFCTPVWFYARTFFTEPWLLAIEVLSLAAFARGRWIAGTVGLGLLLLIKESVLPLVGIALLYALWRHGFATAIRWAAGPAVAMGLFLLKNRWVAGEWWTTFQPYEIGDPAWGLLGCLVGPRHGLLTFAPITILAIAGAFAGSGGTARPKGHGVAAAAAFLAILAVTAAWRTWWGGSCHGPRLLLPVLPVLAILLEQSHARWGKRRLYRRAFEVAAVVGFTWQWAAITHPFHAFWSMSIGELISRYPAYIVTGALLGAAVLVVVERFVPDASAPSAA